MKKKAPKKASPKKKAIPPKVKPTVWQTTRRVEVTEGRTLTEYLSDRGVPRTVQLETTVDFNPEAILRVEAGRKYQMGGIIAKGGMGAVYHARDLNCRRRVAVKVLPKEQKSQVEDLLRFIEEAQITSQLEHPNIVPVHELGIDAEGNVYYTMKYVRGVTLTEVLDGIRRGIVEFVEQYPLARLLTIFQKACDAVAFAHAKGVVHRDLKPDNIMLGDYGEVQVMDWGLAKVVKNAAVSSSTAVPIAVGLDQRAAAMDAKQEARRRAVKEIRDEIESVRTDTIGSGLRTMSGRVMGTPGFMAPEQAKAGEAIIDTRTDIYSLGAILYSILALRPSVSSKDIKESLRRILAGDIVPPLAFNDPEQVVKVLKEKTGRVVDPKSIAMPHCPGGQIPEVLSDIAMKAMAMNPAERYPTVKDLQQEVEAYQDGLIWHVVADEDFSKVDAADLLGRWEAIGGQHEIVDGELRMRGGEPQILLLKRDVSGDVRIEFECYEEGLYLSDVGCFLGAIRLANRRQVPASGYELKYGAYENTSNVLMRSDIKVWTERVSPITRGTKYRVLAERIGSRLRLVVNDQEIFKYSDPDPLSGSDRTAVGILGWRADSRYTRVKVLTLSTPMKSDILDTAERHLQKGHYVTAMDLFQEVIDSEAAGERLRRAQRGREAAENRRVMMQNLAQWQAKLEKAWPGVPIQARMDNDGLTVEVTNAGVTDLEPLRGLPLTTLYCNGNKIKDLEPLRGMRLITLSCSGNPLESLEPLRGMPLVTLFCECCRITSLDPVRETKLTMLNCGGNPGITTLEPLRGLPLNWLCAWGCPVSTLEPLAGMRLTTVYADHTGLTGLEPLKGMPLNILHISGNRISSLEPLRGSSLTMLHAGHNELCDLSPLKGLSLTMFSCHANRVKSLAPLKGMPLGALMCGANELTGVEPFLKNPPEIFAFESDTISTQDLEWIRTAWSRDFRLAPHAREVDILLALRKGDAEKLRSLAAEFRGSRYLYVPKYVAWAEAKACAERMGGHLLTISSPAENDFISSLFPAGCWFWLGLRTTEQGQEWVTGEPVTYAAFIDVIRERILGPKVFFSGAWSYDVDGEARNTFMIEWDEGTASHQ